MDDRKSVIKEAIRTYRADKTLAAFARECGVSKQVMNKWHKGISEPSLKTLEAMPDTPFKMTMLTRLYGGG